MQSRGVLLWLCLVGCAHATGNGGGGTPDAAVGDPDAPAIDAAVIDASAIDAPVVDAAEADAPVVDAAELIDAVETADAPVVVDASMTDASVDAAMVDAAMVDASTPDAMVDAGTPDAMSTTGHLLLSEIELAPSGGEFIEIVNPTSQPVALDHYYVSDNGNYWKLPAGTETLDTDDFIIQFKAGSTIAPKGVITISTDTTANFKTANGVSPTYSIADGTVTVVKSSGTPGLTNGGEIVVLFYWDGQSDLVSDVDIMLAGAPSAQNGLVSKSGQSIDGPDADTTPSTYKTDANTIKAQASAPGSGLSTKRIAPETGHETQAGTGNGITGDDETSEDTAATWDTSFSAPTPGSVPAALVL